MKKFLCLIALAALTAFSSCSRYETVQGDPMDVKIFPLVQDENGKAYQKENTHHIA